MKKLQIPDYCYSKLEEIIPLYVEWFKKYHLDVFEFSKMSKDELINDVLYHSLSNQLRLYQEVLSEN